MRAFTLAVLLAYTLSSPILASTKVYPVEDFLHVHFDGEDAQTLLSSLNLPEGQTSGGPGKTFATADNSVELSCFKRHYNVVAYACEAVFDLRGFSKTTKAKESALGLQIELVDEQANAQLARALNVAGNLEEGESSKVFITKDKKFRLDCQERCSFFLAI